MGKAGRSPPVQQPQSGLRPPRSFSASFVMERDQPRRERKTNGAGSTAPPGQSAVRVPTRSLPAPYTLRKRKLAKPSQEDRARASHDRKSPDRQESRR